MINISEKVAEQIAQEHLQPRSAWIFKTQRLLWSFMLGISVFFGSWALAIIWFLLTNQDWELFWSSNRQFKNVILAIPYLWLLLLVILTASSFYYFRHIRRGYRQPIIKVLLAVFLISALGAWYLVVSGWAEALNNYLANSVPRYDQAFDSRNRLWFRPSEGYLTGRIVQVGDWQFILLDANQHLWQVFWQEEVLAQRGVVVAPGYRIKAIGYVLDNQRFMANEFRVWTCPQAVKCRQARE